MPREAKPTIAEVLKAAAKKHDLHVGSLTSVAEEVNAVSTGNIAIDHIIGVGGLPLGRSVELFGPPSSGKTTTALQAAAHLQRIIVQGGDPKRGIKPTDKIVYFDYEHAMDPTYVKELGLDVDHESFLFAQPDTLEQGANVARDLIATGEVRMTVWDSVAAMTPSVKMDADIGKSLPAVQAKLMSEFLSTLNPLLHENNCAAVFLNHIMEVMDMGARRPGMPARTSTPGGRALKFYASLRVEYQQVGNIKEKVIDSLTQEEIDQVTATNVRVRVIKNKLAPPFKQALVRVRYGKGFDNFYTAMQILIAYKRVVYSSGYYYFEKSPLLVTDDMPRGTTGNKRPYIRGDVNLFAYADEFPEWSAKVIQAARLELQAGQYPDVNEAPSEMDEPLPVVPELTPPPSSSPAKPVLINKATGPDGSVVSLDDLLSGA